MQETGKGHEVHTRHHRSATDPVNRQVWKYKWYVDAEFAVHTDMRSHTSGFMTMGTGRADVKTRKKK